MGHYCLTPELTLNCQLNHQPLSLSSEQSMESSLSVDICHSSDGSIIIAPIQPVESTAKFEAAYTEGDRTLYRLV